MWDHAKAIAYLIKTLLLYSNHHLIACILQAALQIQYQEKLRVKGIGKEQFDTIKFAPISQ